MENRSSFGLHAADYRRFRPTYPDALYAYLAGLCPQRRAALDCATGNGQAALALARYFTHVYAFDNSARQIEEAPRHPRIEYAVHEAENLAADIGPFDLVTVAQGAHWFDLPAFYAALRPVLVDGAVVAIWGYSHCRITPAIDALLAPLLLEPVAPYWAEGNRVISEAYSTIEFPFEPIEAPRFLIHERWDRATFFGYVRTWSAYKRYRGERGEDLLAAVAAALDAQALWPRAEVRPVEFDVHMRVGRYPGRVAADGPAPPGPR